MLRSALLLAMFCLAAPLSAQRPLNLDFEMRAAADVMDMLNDDDADEGDTGSP